MFLQELQYFLLLWNGINNLSQGYNSLEKDELQAMPDLQKWYSGGHLPSLLHNEGNVDDRLAK